MLVSAIMPVFNRRRLVPMALASFLSQDWPEKELVVIDDGEDVLQDLFADVPDVRYLRVPGRQRIGAKRNLACEAAQGELIVHFDSDDWSAPGRISDQVERLLAANKSVSGYHSLLFWNPARREASKYAGASDYSCGSALCYRRSFWEANRFPNSSVGEDNAFVMAAQAQQQIVSVDGGQMMVALIHDDNTSKHQPLQWPTVDVAEIPAAYFEALR